MTLVSCQFLDSTLTGIFFFNEKFKFYLFQNLPISSIFGHILNKAKRSAKQQRPDVLICFLLASWRSDRAKRLKQNNKSCSAQLLTAAGRCKNHTIW